MTCNESSKVVYSGYKWQVTIDRNEFFTPKGVLPNPFTQHQQFRERWAEGVLSAALWWQIWGAGTGRG